MSDSIVFRKSKKFSVRIVNLYKYLYNNKKEFVMSKQLLKSGTSIGANIAEALCAISKKDFLAKMYISFKECAETLYWLDILRETQYISEEEYNSIYNDCKEIQHILASITKTTRNDITPNF